VIKITKILKKSDDHNSGVLLLLYRGILQHVSVQRDNFQVIYIYRITVTVKRYCIPYFDVVVGLVWSHDPKSYAGGSVCYW
jgi:hypothetical protein